MRRGVNVGQEISWGVDNYEEVRSMRLRMHVFSPCHMGWMKPLF